LWDRRTSGNVAPVSCAIELVPPVFFVRWKVPELLDIARLNTRLIEAENTLGRPVFFVAIVPEDCKPPDDRMRQAFADTMEDVLRHCRTMHFVMEGEGFKHSILRNALATVLLIRGQRNRIFVHRSLGEALIIANQQASTKEKFDIGSVTRKATAAGLITNVSSPRATSTK
jgi:hypothetical protein